MRSVVVWGKMALLDESFQEEASLFVRNGTTYALTGTPKLEDWHFSCQNCIGGKGTNSPDPQNTANSASFSRLGVQVH
jgi:hypothetical protein